MTRELRRSQEIILAVLSVLFFFALFVLLLGANMQKNMSHDQHQFIASGALLAGEFQFPYVDYPYFHMPNMVLVYAALFSITDHLVLAARVFFTICVWLSLAVVFPVAVCLFRNYHYLLRFLIAAGCVILIVTNPLFVSTTDKSRNHDLSVLLALLAFIFHSLAAFREEDAPFSFGREGFTQRLVEAVQRHPMVTVIVGLSSCGRSSAVFAGLLLRLRDSGDWLGAEPFRARASALLPILSPELGDTDRLLEARKMANALFGGDLPPADVVALAPEKQLGARRLSLVVDSQRGACMWPVWYGATRCYRWATG